MGRALGGSAPDDVMDWKEVDTTYCGVGAATELVGDRWTQLILREIFFGVHRYRDIHQHIGLSTKVLAARLKDLCEHDVLTKSRYQEQGQRHWHEYHLTERGLGLVYVQMALAQFGYDYLIAEKHRLVDWFDTETGQRVRVGLIREDGTPIDAESLETRVSGDAQAGN